MNHRFPAGVCPLAIILVSAEVDFIMERGGMLTPMEVKWTENPTLHDARHLVAFLHEKKNEAQHGYVICRCPRPLQLHDRITALPWFCL
ncbi:MAG: hypothetical protein WCQ21_30795 [Verrucomicrobiota bacterium]